MTDKVKVGKTFRSIHEFKDGNTRPFRANCFRCGMTKQHLVHRVIEN